MAQRSIQPFIYQNWAPSMKRGHKVFFSQKFPKTSEFGPIKLWSFNIGKKTNNWWCLLSKGKIGMKLIIEKALQKQSSQCGAKVTRNDRY